MSFTREEQAVIWFLVIALVAGMGLLAWRNARIPPLEMKGGIRAEAGPEEMPGPGTGPQIAVHVAGAVARPGVYWLGAGSRVCQAIEAAGGETGEACLEVLNMASVLRDGDKVYVPTSAEVREERRGKVNINTATRRQLEDLPGIGPALAERIIHHRERSGWFRTVEGLLEVPGIGRSKLDQIRHLITVE